MSAVNQAAWLDAVNQPLRVGPAEMARPCEGEIVIRNQAIAINPVSWKIQDSGIVAQKWPVILDYDVAGIVYEIGPGVTRFCRGDRVVAWLQGPMNPEDSKYGAFQLYSVANTITAAKLPDDIPFAEGCILPVACNTAVVGLCGRPGQGFNLPYPSLNPAPSGKTVVIWGASSSVGIMSLQIAKASGVKAIAVASAHNFDLCRSCGAVEMLDYHNTSIIDDVLQAVKRQDGDFVGILDCVSLPDESLKFCIPVLERLGGGELGILLPHIEPKVPSKSNIMVTHVLGRDQDITYVFWKDYLTSAIERGIVKCLPEALVVGHGLDSLQKALDVQRRGVSAKKVVVTLE